VGAGDADDGDAGLHEPDGKHASYGARAQNRDAPAHTLAGSAIRLTYFHSV